jgi:AraC-like DNA-binding protein
MMSHMRQAEDTLLVRGYAVTHPPGRVRPPQSEGWDQLIYASRGVMRVDTAAGVWVVPPHRAVWVPAGVEHRLEATGRLALRTLYFASSLAVLPAVCRAVDVTPLLRELILEAHREAPLDLRTPAHERLAGVIVDQLRALPTAPLQLPTPRDPRARRAAALLREARGAGPDVAELGRAVGASRRTLERRFRAETGMTLGRWRQRLQVIEALRVLADGGTVTEAALAVGYATPSAFGAMFRRELGDSPGRYFEG